MNNLYMQLGDLALTKLAGEIDNDEFEYHAMSMVKQAGGAAETAKKLGKAYWDALTMKEARKAMNPSRIRGWIHGDKYNYGDLIHAGAKSTAVAVPSVIAAGTLYDTIKDHRGARMGLDYLHESQKKKR